MKVFRSPGSAHIIPTPVLGSNLRVGVPMEALDFHAAVGGWYHD